MNLEESVILVGVDGSVESLTAVGWAAAEAASTGCVLVICHAIPGCVPLRRPVPVPFDRLVARADRIVGVASRRARAAAPGLAVETEVVSQGLPAAALLDRSADARLVVVGSRGTGMFRGLLLGSTSQQVATHAAGPVVVVHDSPVRPAAAARAPVTIGVDWTGYEPSLGFAFDYAARHDRPLVAMHAHRIPEPPPRHSADPADRSVLPGAAEDLLADATAAWREKYPSVPVRERVITDRPAAALIRESARSALLVVGPRGHGGFTGLLLGSVSQHVLRHGRGAIAVVR
jgi:nucleotide-binding universal stress UspA family protein